MVPCGVCGTPIDPATANYDKAGRQVCKRCEAQGVIVEGDMKATDSIFVSAVVIGVSGLFSPWCFNPFLILSAITIFGAIGWMVGAKRLGPDHRRQLGGKLTAAWVLVSISLAIHVIVVALTLFAVAAMPSR